jgi:hypothetical protein
MPLHITVTTTTITASRESSEQREVEKRVIRDLQLLMVEWVIIGLLGQIPVKLQEPVHPNWHLLRHTDECDFYLVR